MSVSNGQDANATTFNNAFISKTGADSKSGDLTLNDKLILDDAASSTITDAQQDINDLKDEFNTATGHDHDGTDSKKVVATNLDTTGGTNGQVLKANGTGGATWENDGGGFVPSNDNRLLRSDTVGADGVQESGITVDDSDAISGVDSIEFASGSSSLLNMREVAAPSTPASGIGRIYIDSTTKRIATKDDAGTVTDYGSGGGYQVAFVKDVKADNTNGGTFTSGAWQTRDLNTLEDSDSIVTSVSSNQFTLPAGQYELIGTADAHATGQHQTRFENTSDSTFKYGTSSYSDGGNGGNDPSFTYWEFTIASSKTFELQHRCTITAASNGFGVANNFGGGEIYSQVIIRKIG